LDDVRLEGVPLDLTWRVQPPEPPSVSDASFSITAGPRTDLFADPGGGSPSLNAPHALARVHGDFQLLARVSVDFGATFDAGALLVWSNADAWAKLALEYSPEGQATIVSVVTRRLSDDCNSLGLAGTSVWLRISRAADACAFHASFDGAVWLLIRHFSVEGWDPVEAGFLAQSPLGERCRATFSDVALLSVALADIRSGD
jgi:regulation of enolase protein 1 (concanavalin A-like superfamily)